MAHFCLDCGSTRIGQRDETAGMWKGPIARYQSHLEGLARQLSAGVRTRFNSDRRCAELFTADGALARVLVRAEFGEPYAAYVTSSFELPETMKSAFKVTLEDAIPSIKPKIHVDFSVVSDLRQWTS